MKTIFALALASADSLGGGSAVFAAASAAEQCANDDGGAGSGSCAAMSSKSGQAAGINLMQRTFVHNGAAPETVLGRDPEDYDCDGDGVEDCGSWDYQMSMCKNQIKCGFLYKFPDFSLSQSCRCRKCHEDPRHKGTAFADPALVQPEEGAPFQAMSWGTFRNWADHLDTCAPWVMPTDDTSLQNLLQFARDKGYKVRISGAGHSAGGIVTDGQNNQVVVLSLAEYTAPGEWEFGMRTLPDGSARATVNAGWTQAHLYAKVRPQGYFLPAQTAGYFFALGGIVANSVHGGAYNAGFVHSYVTGLRVMTFDGEIKIIDKEEDLRYWRCSFGLLGIILGIEFQLEKREHLQMYTVTEEMTSWSADEFWKFIKQDAEADIPLDIVAAGGSHGTRKSWNGEYFVDFVNDVDTPTISVYAQKANKSVDMDFDGELGIPSKIERNYQKLMEKRVTDDWHGAMSWGEAARRDGAPPIKIAGVDVNDFLNSAKALPLAKMMSKQAIVNIPRLAKGLSKKVNDGFFLTQSPAALAAAYFVHPSKAFEAMDYLRKVQLESIDSKDFVWNLPGEFRFINVQDSAVLQPIKPGLWFNAQMISFADLAKNAQAWKRDFKKVEDHWVKVLKAQPHMGKLFGFEQDKKGEVEPFADSYSCTIYTSEQKSAFSSYRERMDPEGLFATGLGMKFLAPCA